MNFLPQAFTSSLFLLSLLLFAQAVLAGDDKEWRPVTAEELAMKTPKVEAGADAEVLFWEVRVDDSTAHEVSRVNYVRVKIFTERGREMFSKYDIRFTRVTSIKDLEARVTRPDGSTILLKKEDIFERDIVKVDGFKVKAKSFAMPGLEVGAILEYRYKEVTLLGLMSMPLIFQRDIPVQTISYYVRPYRGRAAMYAQPFNVGDTWFEDDKNGYKRVTMTNLPAFPREPNMLPEDEVRAWMHLYYSRAPNIKKPDEYWKDINDQWYPFSSAGMKPSDEVKRSAAEVTSGAVTDDEKLKRIYDFVQGQIKNLSYAQDTTPEDWKKVEGDKSPAEILKLKMGNSGQVDYLFAAMARAAGFDARAAYTGNRSEVFFNQRIANAELMLKISLIAIKVGEDWRFFSPSSFDVPYGMLRWVYEDQAAMISDPKEPIWKDIKLSTAEMSVSKRTGRFKLLADGTLEGETRIEFTGHAAAYHKAVNRGDSAAEQEKTLREYVKNSIFSTAEIETFNIENIHTGTKPFIYIFKLRVPNYAARTGKRLFFQPNIFERNAKPRFTAGTRKSEIFFTYPWLEMDDLTIELPAGFTLENADAPPSIMDRGGIGKHETQMLVSKDGKLLTYRRKFSFGNGGAIRFGTEAYPVMKDMFEAFFKANTHQLTLREAAVAPK